MSHYWYKELIKGLLITPDRVYLSLVISLLSLYIILQSGWLSLLAKVWVTFLYLLCRLESLILNRSRLCDTIMSPSLVASWTHFCARLRISRIRNTNYIRICRLGFRRWPDTWKSQSPGVSRALTTESTGFDWLSAGHGSWGDSLTVRTRHRSPYLCPKS